MLETRLALVFQDGLQLLTQHEGAEVGHSDGGEGDRRPTQRGATLAVTGREG